MPEDDLKIITINYTNDSERTFQNVPDLKNCPDKRRKQVVFRVKLRRPVRWLGPLGAGGEGSPTQGLAGGEMAARCLHAPQLISSHPQLSVLQGAILLPRWLFPRGHAGRRPVPTDRCQVKSPALLKTSSWSVVFACSHAVPAVDREIYSPNHARQVPPQLCTPSSPRARRTVTAKGTVPGASNRL